MANDGTLIGARVAWPTGTAGKAGAGVVRSVFAVADSDAYAYFFLLVEKDNGSLIEQVAFNCTVVRGGDS